MGGGFQRRDIRRRHHASENGRLLSAEPDLRRVRRITSQYRCGPLLYTFGLAMSFVNVLAGVGAALALAIFFALPEKLGGETE